MQITIHKGPNDQTKRFVNSDNAQLQWNNVNFGDKKYIELQCPHCKAISVTFNVSLFMTMIFVSILLLIDIIKTRVVNQKTFYS